MRRHRVPADTIFGAGRLGRSAVRALAVAALLIGLIPGPVPGAPAAAADPPALTGITNATTISSGQAHSCPLLETGSVRCWGSYNANGQLGNGTFTGSTTPVTVSNITTADAITAGGHHSCATLSSGQTKCWRHNGLGELGNGTTNDSSVPVVVIGGACESAPNPEFSDGSTGAYYYDSVAWLVKTGITSGTSAGKYSPNQTVTRAQMAVFLSHNTCGPRA